MQFNFSSGEYLVKADQAIQDAPIAQRRQSVATFISILSALTSALLALRPRCSRLRRMRVRKDLRFPEASEASLLHV